MKTLDNSRLALRRGILLNGYRVLDVLGIGGFGITYLAEELRHGRIAAIKEYLPNEVAVRDGGDVLPKSSSVGEDFEWGLARFVDEARILAQLEHSHVVRVHRYFEANNTAYIVMEYEEGKPLSTLLEQHGVLTEDQLKRLLLPLLDGLREVHAQNFLHRDIKPSNIYVRRRDETPVLLDFGAARHAVGRRSRKMTAIVTPGYSPPEQYESESEIQGPWSDIYALAALCFRAITGDVPAASLRRRRADPVPSLAETAEDFPAYSATTLDAVDWGLRLEIGVRPQNVDEWLGAINDHGVAGGHQAGREPGIRGTRQRSRRLRIGRGQDADVVLPHGSVSRLHAQLTVAPPLPVGHSGHAMRCIIEDCDSRNGTFVWRNGRWRRISKEAVRPYDLLRLGDYETSPEALAALGREWLEGTDDEPPAVVTGDLADEYERPDGPVRRNPRSGEVIL